MASQVTVEGGPPRGRGHYNDDGRWWWDDAQERWLRTADDEEETLEIELEDYGQSSLLRSITTTLTGQFGAQSYRFLGRAHSTDPRWEPFTASSSTFPVLPLQVLEKLGPRDAYADEIFGAWHDLQRTLEEHGWRPAGRGERWWSTRYTRPGLVVDEVAVAADEQPEPAAR